MTWAVIVTATFARIIAFQGDNEQARAICERYATLYSQTYNLPLKCVLQQNI